jgi:hypothetical protein
MVMNGVGLEGGMFIGRYCPGILPEEIKNKH